MIEGLSSLNPAHAVSVNASYTYDALNRLTAVQYSNGKSLSYSYDAAGNITQIVTAGGVSPTPTPTVLPLPSTWSTLLDNDVDGIPSEVEKAVVEPAGEAGDGNGDGIADNEQATVASTPLTNKNDQVDFVTLILETNASTPAAQLKQVEQRALPANFPTNIAMPFGLVAFSAENIPVGGLVNFPIYVNSTVPVNGYFKQNAAGTWVNIATAIQTVGTKTRID